MKKSVHRTLLWALSVSLLGPVLAGCAAAPTPTQPVDIDWVKYNSSEDGIFLPKDIYSAGLFIPGLVPAAGEDFCLEVTDSTDAGAFVIAGEYGKCYEVKIPAGATRVSAARMSADPRQLDVGKSVRFSDETTLYDSRQVTGAVSFMYTCRKEEEYLVVYTGSSDPIYIGERTILAEKDTQSPWFTPEPVGSLIADCTWGNYRWTSEEVITNLYEPVRQRHPGYITRSVIGKDATGQYDMYGYIYEPKGYEITMFLTGGMHANEETGYFALAKIMQLIADATPEDPLLYTLRQKVRFVVVPLINVWGVSQSHDGMGGIPRERIRYNGNKVDLNRDFGDLSQTESQNVIAYLEQQAKDAVIAMDFHTAKTEGIAMWFNFINFTDNAVANYKTTNHMYHRYMELGLSEKLSDIAKVPGSYTKSDKYIEGRIWNSYGIPTITVEYVVNSTFPNKNTTEGMTLAVETYGNFIVQNALYFLQK